MPLNEKCTLNKTNLDLGKGCQKTSLKVKTYGHGWRLVKSPEVLKT